jgi:anthranilate synthase component 1
LYYPTLEEVKKLKGQGNLVPICRDIIADLETPVSAFLKINRGGYSFLLESVEGGQRIARYSFIGTEPYRIMTGDAKNGDNPLPSIAAEISRYKLIPMEGLPRFCGGAVGYASYETATRFEKLPSPDHDSLNLPESLFMFVDTMLVYDHVTHMIKVISLARLNEDIDHSYQDAIKKIDSLVERLNQPLPAQEPQRPKITVSDDDITSNFQRKEFEQSVNKVKDYITSGEAIQVVISQRLARPTTATPFEIYRALRTINPSPYMFFLDLKDFHIIGASPEVLVRVENDVVTTRPLAGTRPRGTNPEHDKKLEEELTGDEKERAEHIMLVDLGRNDIGRVSEPGTVQVSELMEIEKYSHVMHIVSNVQGKLRHDMTSFDAFRACFPAGTVSGAPKIRAMEIIAEMEPDRRGPYAGAVGYFSFSGNMDMAITIRTIVMQKEKVYVQAGCGIVYDSVPEREYEETMNKARAMLRAINEAENQNSNIRTGHAGINRQL